MDEQKENAPSDSNDKGTVARYLVPGVLGLLVIFFVGAVFYWAVRKPAVTPAAQPKDSLITKAADRAPEAVLAELNTNATLTIPEVISAVDASADVLPKEIGIFASGSIKDLKVQTVIFKNGKKGFVAKYDKDAKLLDAVDDIRSLFSANGLVITAGVRNDQGAVTDGESKNFVIRIEQVTDKNGSSPVHITITAMNQ
ncbi:MAG: hypothetical protein ABI643_03870 [Candidatus Doudnabacteria bacterium]